MKRDMDLIRSLALRLEEQDEPMLSSNLSVSLNLPDYTNRQIDEHLLIMQETGWIEGKRLRVADGNAVWGGLRLTLHGHEFVAAARDDKIWQQAMSKSGATMDTVLRTLMDFAQGVGIPAADVQQIAVKDGAASRQSVRTTGETMGTVKVEMGDIFEGGMDLTVLPCSAKGTVSTATRRWLTVFGIPVPKEAGMMLQLGSLSEVLDFPGPKNITKKVVFAASVLNDYSSFEVIENLSRQIGALTQSDPLLRHIETPLLGTGAGGLSTEVAGEALYRGFTAASSAEARLYLFVFDNERKKLLDKLIGGLAKQTPVPLASDLVLAPVQVEQLQEALLAAFTRSELEQLTFVATGHHYAAVVGQGNLTDEVWNLILWANRRNKVRNLLRQARERNPDNVLLRSFVESIG